jgi:hypothetical protein
MKTPEYVLIQTVDEDLPAGSFISPIYFRYLPRGWEISIAGGTWINHDTQVVCYTKKGLRIIQRANIRQVS